MLDKRGKCLDRGDSVKLFGQIDGTFQGYTVTGNGEVMGLVLTDRGSSAYFREEIVKIQVRNPLR